MYAWAYLLFYLLGENCEASNEGNESYYECGRHGRFEYCIDGIPGCVVGCHCHPGYYFDTDTKICEPNEKLTQDYRRHYMLEPTRLPVMTLAPVAQDPTPTTVNPMEEKVDAIAKDTDDLGDWLYNQFFKTIENQVINSTDDDKATRRSGSQVAKPIPRSLRRSTRKRNKNKSKKKRFKKKGLRRKLLRITEDDSLFDSSSDSSSDYSSSSSSSDSDTSAERHVYAHSSENEHGHRKILMINKKPTPPLPSFIFLPNMETPFYPPIGLPPPPILPMYPMVPVPPVAPYYPGYPVNCNDSETTSAPTTTTANVDATTTDTTIASDASSTTDPDNSPNVRARETSDERNKKTKINKHGERNKIMQQIRDQMKRQNKRLPLNRFANNYQDPETPYSFNPEPPSGPIEFRSRNMYDPIPQLEDVDFKYLSQLIHKIDLNKTKPSQPIKPKQKVIDLPNAPFRRNYANTSPLYYDSNQKMRPASKADEINDSYYSNLGRQIATLIRKVDTDGERQINIEIEQQNQDPMQTMFNENRYAPRSYWERFVRSPLKSRQSYVKELNYLKNSNDKLFNLEDQVSVAAAIGRSLSLQELENIANVMERTQSKSRQKSSKNVIPATSSRSYNINLLPRFNRRTNAVVRMNDKQNSKVKDEVSPNKNILSTLHYNIYPTHIPRNAIMSKKHINETHRNPSVVQKTRTSGNKKELDFLNKIFKSSRKTPLRQQISRIVPKNITNSAQQVTKYQLNPMMLNYKSLKYVGNNHNRYQLQHSFMPLQMPFFPKPTAQSIRSRPSYFHHELHHFDYFD